MSDHFDDDPRLDIPRAAWDSYTRDAEYVPMLPPSQVRRLGERRRTRRRVGVASGALALALLAGSALALNGSMFGSDDPQWAGTPSPSASSSVTSTTRPSPTPTDTRSTPAAKTDNGLLSAANLPSGAEIYLLEPNDLMFETSAGIGGRGEQDALGVCDGGLMNFPGTVAEWQGIYGGPAEGVPNPQDYSDYEVEAVVMQFVNDDAAKRALATITGWYAGCDTKLKGINPKAGLHAEPVLVEGGATIHYYAASISGDNEMYQNFENSVVIQSGPRVLVMFERLYGQDNNGVGPYNAQLPDQHAGLSRFVQHYKKVIERLDS
ncbi:hypothetical protein [Aestuariimicrobium ganziense]|uniref:hypothetical protein n=1 Tax=Aestuariimicrobium ganziense TaxID=2773677 RepID=UPI0019408649|nr:hypothetical protein [Aestuariimicrobium ganziense]